MAASIPNVSIQRMPLPAPPLGGAVQQGGKELVRARGAFPVKSEGAWRFSDNGLSEIVRSYYDRSKGLMFDGSRFHAANEYLFTNEADYFSAISSLKGKGGAYVGVGHMMSFTYPAWQGAAHAYGIDINPRMPFLNIPMYGLMLSMASDRIEFASLLAGKPIPKTSKWRRVIDSSSVLLIEDLRSLRRNADFLKTVDEALVNTLSGAASYIDSRDIGSDAFALLAGVRNSILNSKSSPYSLFNPLALMMAKDAAGRGGPLSSEEQFQRERALFIDGRITGIASPIQGAGFDAAMARISSTGDPLRVMYISNLEDWFFDDLDAEFDSDPAGSNVGPVVSSIATLYRRLGGRRYPEESLLVSAKGCYPTVVDGLNRYLGGAMPFDQPDAMAGMSANMIYRLRRESARAMREPIRQRPKALEAFLIKRPTLAEIPAALRRGWRGRPLGAKDAHEALLKGSGYYSARLTEWERLAVLRIMQETGIISRGEND